MNSNWARIYRAVKRVRRGEVATYGDIAALAGLPGHARQVGYALRALPSNTDVPWHRVVNARGEISVRSSGDSHELQRHLLEGEGVTFRGGRIEMERHRIERSIEEGRPRRIGRSTRRR